MSSVAHGSIDMMLCITCATVILIDVYCNHCCDIDTIDYIATVCGEVSWNFVLGLIAIDMLPVLADGNLLSLLLLS